MAESDGTMTLSDSTLQAMPAAGSGSATSAEQTVFSSTIPSTSSEEPPPTAPLVTTVSDRTVEVPNLRALPAPSQGNQRPQGDTIIIHSDRPVGGPTPTPSRRTTPVSTPRRGADQAPSSRRSGSVSTVRSERERSPRSSRSNVSSASKKTLRDELRMARAERQHDQDHALLEGHIQDIRQHHEAQRVT